MGIPAQQVSTALSSNKAPARKVEMVKKKIKARDRDGQGQPCSFEKAADLTVRGGVCFDPQSSGTLNSLSRQLQAAPKPTVVGLLGAVRGHNDSTDSAALRSASSDLVCSRSLTTDDFEDFPEGSRVIVRKLVQKPQFNLKCVTPPISNRDCFPSNTAHPSIPNQLIRHDLHSLVGLIPRILTH